jgi:hypothetical protein
VIKKNTSESNKCEGVLFFYGKGVVHREFVPHRQMGQWIVLLGSHEVREAEQRKRLEEWRKKTGILHHDIAPARVSLSMNFW